MTWTARTAEEQQWKMEDALDRALRAETWKPGEQPALFAELGVKVRADKPRGAPVRRNSRRKGREGVFWRPTRRADLRILVRAAKRYELAARLRPGCRGALGASGLAVFEAMIGLVDYATGQLDPSYETLAQRTGYARSTVIEAVRRLNLAGFVEWIRRYVDDPQPGRKGPQVKQTSNAYRITMPAWIGRLLGVFAHGAPLPEDDEDRRRDGRSARQRWEFEESPLFEALGRLRSAIVKSEAQRGSDNPSEPPSKFNSYNGSGGDRR